MKSSRKAVIKSVLFIIIVLMIEILTVALTRPKTGIDSNPQNVIADDVNRDNQLHVIITIPRNDSITMLL